MQLKSGTQPTHIDYRDFDFAKSFGLAAPPAFPAEYNVDAQLWQPDQNAMGLPFGCTGFTQASLCEDEDGTQYDPAYIYRQTPPFDEGGRDIRKSLDFIRKNDLKKYLKGVVTGTKRTAYFNIRPMLPLDAFDAIRLAMFSTKDEKRAVSVGTPWFPEFENTDRGILPMPHSFDVTFAGASWHNWAIKGWKTIGDQPYLIGKSWQGADYGDAGFCYVSRSLINNLMAISGSAAFTVSKIAPDQVQRIDLDFFNKLMSIIYNLLASIIPSSPTPVIAPQEPKIEPTEEPTPTPISTPPMPKYLWGTPPEVRHSIRVICDEEGLTVEQKNTLCATIQCESGFKLDARNDNIKDGKVTSTDWGLCQWNSHYHAKEITPDEAVHNPEKAVRLMCHYWKRDQRKLWVCYLKNMYQQYM
jgi:hypothetical protein